jgi:hypothetical protein
VILFIDFLQLEQLSYSPLRLELVPAAIPLIREAALPRPEQRFRPELHALVRHRRRLVDLHARERLQVVSLRRHRVR